MHEIPTAHLHLDFPGPGQALAAGRAALRGWLVPKPGRHYTDVRLVVGPMVFPGVHGFPRSDLAAFFKSDRPYLLAGFEITVDLAAGAHEATLEGCTIAGNWESLDNFVLTVVPRPDPAEPFTPVPIRAHEAGEALRVLLRRMGGGDRSLADTAAVIARETPWPHFLRHPHLPFHGHLDEPPAWARSVFGRVAISGWLFHETQPIRRVFATTDLQAVQNLRFGRETPFLAALHPGASHALRCGFDGFLDFPAQLPAPVTVRVYAELADGSWHLGAVTRVTTTDQEFAKQPFGRFSLLAFWRAARAWGRAAAARGLTLETGRPQWQEFVRVWRDYRAQAPRRRHEIQPRAPATSASTPAKFGRVHLFTHNLGLEGAPLFLLEYARHLNREAGATLCVTSGKEGPLRRGFEALGASVQVVDDQPLLDPPDGNAVRHALDRVAGQVDLTGADLVVANTLSAYWGIHLARRAGKPALLYIHESTSPRSFFRGLMPASALAVVEESFRLADRVSFLTATTQRYYGGLSDQSNYVLHPGWIDLAAIDRFRAAAPRAALRSRLGFAPDRKVVVNIGTVCDRKGQHVFARSVDLLWRLAPDLAAAADFLMVGGRDTAYDRELADFLGELNRPNLRVVPETSDVYSYYGAADLFACSSFEESFPRVILEAMAFELPIVSTAVHGIPEMVRAEQEALLVPAGDTAALASGLRRLLAEPATARRFAQHARARVAAEFASRIVLPRHVELARALAAAP